MAQGLQHRTSTGVTRGASLRWTFGTTEVVPNFLVIAGIVLRARLGVNLWPCAALLKGPVPQAGSTRGSADPIRHTLDQETFGTLFSPVASLSP